MIAQETMAYLENQFPSVELIEQEEFGASDVKAFATTLVVLPTLATVTLD
jgi:hypothetical protein